MANAWPSTGTAGRLVVCVPGLGGAADEWTDVAPGLTRHGDVIAVEPTMAVTSADPLAPGPLRTTLGAVDRALGGRPEHPVLIGHSMGAVASMLIAANGSHRLGGLVLTAPFMPVARNGRSTFVTVADYAWHRVLFLAGARGRHRRSGLPTVNRRDRAAGLRTLAKYGLRPGAFHTLADRVDCPVLIVHGSNDHYVPPAFALAAVARHPAWQLKLIAGAGHFPHRDHPSAWLGIVDPWLQRL